MGYIKENLKIILEKEGFEKVLNSIEEIVLGSEHKYSGSVEDVLREIGFLRSNYIFIGKQISDGELSIKDGDTQLSVIESRILDLITKVDELIGELQGERIPGEKFKRSLRLFFTETVYSQNAIKIKIDPGTAPKEKIAELLAKMSLLYRRTGGSGIHFIPEDVSSEISENEVV